MLHVRALVVAASLFGAAVLPSSVFAQQEGKNYFLQVRPLVAEIGAYTDASRSGAAALSLLNPRNDLFKSAAAHAKTADQMQDAIEGLWYWVGTEYPYTFPRLEGQTQAEFDAEEAAFFTIYTYDPIFTTYYLPLRNAQALYSQYAAYDVLNGKGRKWTASSLAVYNHCSKAASLGRYDALHD